MSRNVRYQYYVEGECEKRLIEELKRYQHVRPGKVSVFNVTQRELGQERLRLLSKDTVVILVFDTDGGNPEILKNNLRILENHRNISAVWCVCQEKNLEDELQRATNVREIKELLGCRSNKDFKTAFIAEKRLYDKLNQHSFNYEQLWIRHPTGNYTYLENNGWRIKTK